MRVNQQQSSSRRGAYLALLAGAAMLTVAPGAALAGQLLYTPVNPDFGGNPLNGPNLLNSAQAQKRFPLPTAGLPTFDNGIVAQTSNTLIFQRGSEYYAYNIDTGTLTLINFNQFSTTGVQP
ncbi:MAG: curli assembly protein CsgF [Bordetella sp.]|uniref:curli assembly protein CsgF n=1 Tax=Bordetella sp. TaxID=28081 RepID=UPI003F7BCB37